MDLFTLFFDSFFFSLIWQASLCRPLYTHVVSPTSVHGFFASSFYSGLNFACMHHRDFYSIISIRSYLCLRWRPAALLDSEIAVSGVCNSEIRTHVVEESKGGYDSLTTVIWLLLPLVICAISLSGCFSLIVCLTLTPQRERER